jgi:integrase
VYLCNAQFTTSSLCAFVRPAEGQYDRDEKREHQSSTASLEGVHRREEREMETNAIVRTAQTSAKERRNPRGVYEKFPGSGEWWICYWDAQGRKRREKSGTKGMAMKLYQKRKTEALQGKKLPETLRKAAVPFKQIAEDAIADIERRYRRPADDKARLKVLIGWFGSCEAASLTAQEIEARLNSAADENEWSPATINHYRTVMSLAYRLARRNRKVEVNPVRDVPHQREDNSRVRCLSPAEEKALRAAIRERYPVHELELDFALNTGLRQGSQYQLTWNMVDWEARVLHIPRTKNEESIHLPLNDGALMVLRNLKASPSTAGRVFISEETGKPLNCPKHWFTDAVRLAGVADFHWHDLRHTFATRLRQRGVALEDIADLLGHKTLVMAKRYAHISMDRLHQAVKQLSATPTDTTTDTEQSGHAQVRVAVAG